MPTFIYLILITSNQIISLTVFDSSMSIKLPKKVSKKKSAKKVAKKRHQKCSKKGGKKVYS